MQMSEKTGLKVAFIHPHSPVYNQDRLVQNRISGIDEIETFPNLSLLTLAAFLGPQDEGIFIDEDYLTQHGLAYDYLDRDYDLAVLTAMNHQAKRAYKIAEHLRSRGVKTVLGGYHASALPEEAGQYVDAVVAGEGEDVFPDVLEDVRQGKLRQLYRSTGKADLKKFPPPRWDLVPDLKWYSKIGIFATRGCGHYCNFCCLWQVYGACYRTKSVEQVLSEIELARSLYPDCCISFTDENMLVDRAFAGELAEKLTPLGIKWECYCDSGIAQDPELLEKLARSGLQEVLIGFESVNADSLGEAALWKQKQGAGYKKTIAEIQGHGIGVLACFVLGFDHDRPEHLALLRDFIRETMPYELDVAALTPMPGTPLYARLKAQGRITNENWEDYSWFRVNFQPLHFDPQELMDGIRGLFDEYNAPENVKKRREYLLSLSPRFKGRV